MDDIHCNGTERRLFDCPHSSVHNCGHSEDASVKCVRYSTKFISYSTSGRDVAGL